MTVRNMLEAIRASLTGALEQDDRVIMLGQDIGDLGGVFRATDGLQARFGEARVVCTPISESAMIGASVGLAASGLVPVVEIQFLGFAHLGYHQMSHQLARMRYRSRGRITTPVTIRCPYGGGVRAIEIHSDAVEALYATVPGLKVVAPATAHDAKGMLTAAIRSEDPVLFLEPLRGYRLVRDEVPDDDYTVPLGQARIARPGEHVTLIAWSGLIPVVERAAETLAAEGIDAEVVDVRSIVPLDVDTLVGSVVKTGRAVVVSEAPLTAGFASEIITTLTEEAFYNLEAPIARVTAPDTPYPFATALEEHYLPDEARIVDAARQAVAA